jgi:hypothetical protein
MDGHRSTVVLLWDWSFTVPGGVPSLHDLTFYVHSVPCVYATGTVLTSLVIQAAVESHFVCVWGGESLSILGVILSVLGGAGCVTFLRRIFIMLRLSTSGLKDILKRTTDPADFSLEDNHIDMPKKLDQKGQPHSGIGSSLTFLM